MKKSLIALAAATAVGGAFAQSSVTIDGVLDIGLLKTDGPAAYEAGVRSNSGADNQLRFRGTEDLGGGLKANFVLAYRFHLWDGQPQGFAVNVPRPLLQGQSTLGLSGGFGEIQLGRALTPFQRVVHRASPTATDNQSNLAFLTRSYATDPRETEFITGIGSNSVVRGPAGSGAGRTDHIAYYSPTFSGFRFGAAWGPKQRSFDINGSNSITATGDQDGADFYSLSATFAQGPIEVNAGYESNRVKDKAAFINGRFNAGFATFTAGYSQIDNNNVAVGSIPAFTGGTEKNWVVGFIVPVGALSIHGGYANSDQDTGTDADKWSLGAYYNFSKRTLSYLTVGSEKRSTETDRRTGIDLGIRHTF